MKNLNKAVLIGGLQNLWQIGAFYPLNLFAFVFFISRARFKIHTSMDVLIAGYVTAGSISLITGFLFNLSDGANSNLLLNSFKSFVVFLTVLVYYGAHDLATDDFFDPAMLVFGSTAIGILITYIYIYLTEPISFYLSRSAISWCSAWPQRWVVFCLIGHFFFLCRYVYTKKPIELIMTLIFLTVVFLSATRSAVLGLIFGHLVLSLMGRRDFFRTAAITVVIVIIASFFVDEIQDAFRINEITEYSSEDGADGSSMNNRVHNLWPGIINSLGAVRIPFGWGHAGLAFIPHEFFVDTSQLSQASGEEIGSAESQYMDVLLRQGVIGLFLFLAINISGIIYSYKLYIIDPNPKRQALWKASFAWQFAIFVHGITVETTRLSLYNLFFFLFLGIASNSYRRLISQRKANGSVFSSLLKLNGSNNA